MGFDVNNLRANPSKELDGVWVDIPTKDGVLRLRIARIGNPSYQGEIERLTRPLRLQTRLGTVDMATMENITIKAMAKYILLGWEGLDDGDQKNVPYSVEKAEELLRIPDFNDLVAAYARDAQLFRDEDEQAVAGN